MYMYVYHVRQRNVQTLEKHFTFFLSKYSKISKQMHTAETCWSIIQVDRGEQCLGSTVSSVEAACAAVS